MTVQHAAIEGWEEDAAYEEFGLESYIGAKVIVDGDVYGTFCFADSRPREQPFTADEETFIELMAQWVGYELSHQRATQEIQKQRDRLEEFANVISHDLRNPLNVAQARLQMAREDCDSDHFDPIIRAHTRMEALIDDLLTLARIGEQVSDIKGVNLYRLVENCWRTVATGEATLKLEIDRVIPADESRLQQLFENLFRNAVEHGDNNVTIRVGELENGFYVEDDGPGIPEDERDKVFEAGYSTADDGTGFGLSIVKQVAKAHGWDVRVTDGDDGGARFEIAGIEFTAT